MRYNKDMGHRFPLVGSSAAAAPVEHRTVAVPPSPALAALIMEPTPEGYEVRWYRLPASLPPGAVIPVSSLEFVHGGAYNHAGELLRPIGPPSPGASWWPRDTTITPVELAGEAGP